MTRSHYYRILALGSFDAVVTLPLNILAMVTNASQADTFWPGWGAVHANISIIAQVPKCVWSVDFWANFALQESRWINVILGAMFFALFGAVPEARAKYLKIMRSILQALGIMKPASQVENKGRQASAILFGSGPNAQNASSRM